MTHIIKQLDDAIQSVLAGNPSLNQMAGLRVYNLQAPPGAALPYVVFQAISGGWTNDSPRDAVDVIYQVIAWSTDQQQAYKLAEQVHAALHRQTLALPNWSNFWLAAERWITRTEWSEGQQFFGVGATY